MEGSSVVISILNDITSPDNSKRVDAEAKLKLLRANEPQLLFQELIKVEQLVDSSQIQVLILATLLLKKFYIDKRPEEKDLWQLSPQDFQDLKDQMLNTLDFSKPMNLLKKKADIICACYKETQNFPELIAKLVAVLTSSEGSQEEIVVRKVYAMYMFELLAEYHLPQDQIVQNQNEFMNLFTQCLKDPSIQVKVSALKAITSFLSSIDDETTVLKYQDIMDWILEVVIDVLRSNEEQGKASLESLIELTESHGDIWTKSITKLTYVVSQIVQNKSFEDSTRQSALEIISTIAEGMPTLLRKCQNELKTQLFPALAHMLSEALFQDDLEEWLKYVEEEVQARNDPSSVAADNINRIASSLGEKTVINCTTLIIKDAIESKDSWQLRQAGYLFLGMISDTCANTFKSNMDEIMKMSANGLLDPHPRVRFEALTSLGLLLTELAPDAQKKYHAQLIQVLLSLMRDEQYIKLRTQATSCMVNFVRGLISEEDIQEEEDEKQKEYGEILAPYAQNLVETISALLQSSLDQNYAPLQEEVLSLLSCLANVLETKFAQYYGKFMPGLKVILHNTPMDTKAQQELRSHCIQTIGFILTAVKDQPDVCKQDAIEVAGYLTELLNSGRISEADPQILAVQNTLSQIGACIKEEFKHFLPHIMPTLLKDAARDIDLKIQDADLAKKDEGSTALNIKVKGMEGERQISLNTNALENKINALQIIKNLAGSLGTGFFEQVEAVAQLIVNELLCYQYSQAVRKLAAQTIVALINACQDSNQMKALFAHIYPTFKARIQNRLEKYDFAELRFLMRELQKSVKQFWNFGKLGEIILPIEQANEMIKLMGEVATAVKEDRVARYEQFKAAKSKMDEEDIEYFHEDIKKVDKIEHHVMEIAGVFIHVYKGQISMAFSDHLLQHFGSTLISMKAAKDYQIQNALCFFCDVIENGGDDLFNVTAGKAAEKFIECIQTFPEDRGLVQSSGFGLGAIAKRYPQGQFPQLKQTLQILHAIISEEDSRTDEDKAESTDNIIGAFGKCVLFQFDNNIVTLAVVKEFLSLLPLYTDSEEAQAIHKLYFEQILLKSPVLMIPEIAQDVKMTAQRIVKIAQDRPHLELIDDEGKLKAEQVINLLQ